MSASRSETSGKFLASAAAAFRMKAMAEKESDLSFNLGYHADVANLKLLGALSVSTGYLLKNKVSALLSEKIGGLVLDVSDLTHMDTGGLIALVTIFKNCGAKNIIFAIHGENPIVERILENSGLSNLFPRQPAPLYAT
jgi:anti-anti-sigma factor